VAEGAGLLQRKILDEKFGYRRKTYSPFITNSHQFAPLIVTIWIQSPPNDSGFLLPFVVVFATVGVGNLALQENKARFRVPKPAQLVKQRLRNTITESEGSLSENQSVNDKKTKRASASFVNFRQFYACLDILIDTFMDTWVPGKIDL
jgi:hypothetical protein